MTYPPSIDASSDDEIDTPSIAQRSALDGANTSFAADILCILCATVAIVSTKFIVVDCYFHYPLHLLTAQLLAFLILSALLDWSATQTALRKVPWLASRDLSPRSVFQLTPSLLISASLIALALPFFAHTILHFPNLPTVGMLIISSYFWEFAFNEAFNRYFCSFGWRAFLIPVLLFISCTTVVILDEYRLEADGLLFVIPTWGIIGLSRAVLSAFGVPLAERSASPDYLPRIVGFTSLGITLSWLASKEDPSKAFANVALVNPAVLALNIITSALTILYFLKNTINRCQDIPESMGPSLHYVLRGLTWSGACAVVSTLTTRPAVSTYVQVMATCAVALGPVIFQLQSGQDISRVNRHYRDSASPHGSRYHSRQGGRQMVELGSSQLMRGGSPSRTGNASNHRRSTSQTSIVQRIKSLASACASPSRVLLAFSIGLWVLFGLLMATSSMRNGATNRSLPRLDWDYKPEFDFDIVVSAFQESPSLTRQIVSRVRGLPNLEGKTTRLWLYTKDEDADLEKLKRESGADHVLRRPNVGREGETYLYHILQQWDHLARHTLFVQAHVHNSWEFFRRIRQYYSDATGMLSLGFVGHVCDCHNCHDRWGFHDDTGKIFPAIYERTMNETCKTALLSYKGQFIASAQRIRGTDKQIFQELEHLISDPQSDAHKPEYIQGEPDSMDAPFFGFTLERLWSMTLQCSNEEIAQMCPSVLSGTRRGGSLADCQCMDDPT